MPKLQPACIATGVDSRGHSVCMYHRCVRLDLLYIFFFFWPQRANRRCSPSVSANSTADLVNITKRCKGISVTRHKKSAPLTRCQHGYIILIGAVSAEKLPRYIIECPPSKKKSEFVQCFTVKTTKLKCYVVKFVYIKKMKIVCVFFPFSPKEQKYESFSLLFWCSSHHGWNWT